ncbi:hypothetical protein MEW_04794 [Candida albicans P60002]|nr:hypothetical protein MEW_04794 [Candida albicans P60002]
MDVSPNNLEFTGSFTKQITEYLTLSNPTNTPLAFKVKTTAPKLYCVRPNASIVQPGDSLQISIILQGFSQPLPNDYKCKDKFLLVSVPAPNSIDPSKVGESWSQLEAQFKPQVVSKKLRVNYVVGPDKPDGGAGVNQQQQQQPSQQQPQFNQQPQQQSQQFQQSQPSQQSIPQLQQQQQQPSQQQPQFNQQPQQQSQQFQQSQPSQQSIPQLQQQQPQQPSQSSIDVGTGAGIAAAGAGAGALAGGVIGSSGYNQAQNVPNGDNSFNQTANRSFDTSSAHNGFNNQSFGGASQQQPPHQQLQQQHYQQSSYQATGGNGYGGNVGGGVGAGAGAGASQPSPALQRELEALARQVQTLSTKLDQNEKSAASRSPVSSLVGGSGDDVSGISLPVALVLVLIAFLIGWLVF